MSPWLRWQGAPCATLHVGKHLLNYAYRSRCVHYNMHKCDEMEEYLEWVMPPRSCLQQIFEGELVPVTPLIGKLRIHIQEYVDQEDFLISPLRHYDVVLGTPWFHHKQV